MLNDKNPNLDIDIDPKLSWALRNLHLFPIDVNKADYSMIMRVPGIGIGSARKIIQARKFGSLRTDQLKKIGISFNRAQHFIVCADTPFQIKDPDALHIKKAILHNGNSKYRSAISNQLSLFQ